jgi:hypothetical protein
VIVLRVDIHPLLPRMSYSHQVIDGKCTCRFIGTLYVDNQHHVCREGSLCGFVCFVSYEKWMQREKHLDNTGLYHN